MGVLTPPPGGGRRSSSRSTERFALGTGVALLLWNNVVHLSESSRRWYVPLNLAAAALLLAAARRRGLTPDDVGVRAGAAPAGLRWGGAAAGAVAAALGLALAVPALHPLLRDERVAGMSAAELVAYVLVRIPLGTVVLEEVAFRGVLPAAWGRRGGWRRGALLSSAVFGLWHVRPTLGLLAANAPDASAPVRLLAVTGSVALTFAAGLVFCALRRRSGSLLAPGLAHVATNSLGATAAAIAQGAR